MKKKTKRVRVEVSLDFNPDRFSSPLEIRVVEGVRPDRINSVAALVAKFEGAEVSTVRVR